MHTAPVAVAIAFTQVALVFAWIAPAAHSDASVALTVPHPAMAPAELSVVVAPASQMLPVTVIVPPHVVTRHTALPPHDFTSVPTVRHLLLLRWIVPHLAFTQVKVTFAPLAFATHTAPVAVAIAFTQVALVFAWIGPAAHSDASVALMVP